MSNNKAYDDADKIPVGACGQETEVYSRVTGYYRPANRWNKGKQEEFKDRKTFNVARDTNVTCKKIDSGYEPQTGIEFNAWEINSK